MGAGIRAEVSLPTSSPSPFDGVVDGSTAIYNVARCRPRANSAGDHPADGDASAAADATEAGESEETGSGGDLDTVVIEFIADADLAVSDGVETVFDYGRKAAYRFETPETAGSPFSGLEGHGVPATETRVRDRRPPVTLHPAGPPTPRSGLDGPREAWAGMSGLRRVRAASASRLSSDSAATATT